MSLLGKAINEAQVEKRVEVDVPPIKLSPYQQELIDKMREWKQDDPLPFQPRRMGSYTAFIDALAYAHHTQPKNPFGKSQIIVYDEMSYWPTFKWYRHPIKWFKQRQLEKIIRQSLNIKKDK